jgi:hypothetical protein
MRKRQGERRAGYGNSTRISTGENGFRAGICPLIRRSFCGCLQLYDRPSDPFPDQLTVEITAFEHQIGASASSKLGVVTMLPDQQVGGSPDVEF